LPVLPDVIRVEVKGNGLLHRKSCKSAQTQQKVRMNLPSFTTAYARRVVGNDADREEMLAELRAGSPFIRTEFCAVVGPREVFTRTVADRLFQQLLVKMKGGYDALSVSIRE
ncbi:hypothetical protein HK101_002581, partial [Irineochytrium annulatum]